MTPGTDAPPGAPEARPDAADGTATPRAIEGEIVSLRDELGVIVGELDRRRRDAFDLRLQLRRHAVAIAVVAGTVALVAAGIWTRAASRRRARARPVARLSGVVRGLEAISRDPEALERALARSRGLRSSVLAGLARGAGARLGRAGAARIVGA